MASKNDIRRRMRRLRRGVRPEDRIRAAMRVTAILSDMRVFKAAGRIAVFAAHDGEISLKRVMRRWPQKRFFLPVLPPAGARRLRFAEVRAGGPLKRNRYGILEPDAPAQSLVAAQGLDLILAPLVAFDRRGGRIGMGGGYYDATLGFLASRTHWCHPKITGVAFSFQEVPHIEADPWDVPLSAVVTELGVISFS